MRFKIILFINIFLVFSFTIEVNAQELGEIDYMKSILSKDNSLNESYFGYALKESNSGDSYQFIGLRAALGALNSGILASGDTSLIRLQRNLIDNVINTAQTSSKITNNTTYKDEFKGWISLTKNQAFQNEVPLYESYIFVYVGEFLNYLHKSGWINLNTENKTWFQEKLVFLENNIWRKWYIRSERKFNIPERYFLRSRVHMGSNWAGFALYLENLTSDFEIKQQCKKLYTDFDTLLKRNLNYSVIAPTSYVWNSTYDIVIGTDAVKTFPPIIQDVSHANHVITYVIAAYEMGNSSWNLNYIHGFCNTLKNLIYNSASNTFSDNVDGSGDKLRPNWGNFVGDGWVKLSKYDSDVLKIFQQYSKSDLLRKYNQELQLKFNFLYFGKN